MLRSSATTLRNGSVLQGRPAVTGTRGHGPSRSALTTARSLKTAPPSTAETSRRGGAQEPEEKASSLGRVDVVELKGEVATYVYSSGQAGPAAVDGEAAASQSQPVQQGEEASIPNRALQALRDWFLPAGYPSSTTPDYLEYQLYTFPTHVLGWLAHSLTTSSLLSAVGLSAGPVGTVATSAGIKWITKDGIGTLGRFFVGGQLAQEFDDDPRYWRMSAEYIATAGAALEIATVAYPQSFLLLASAGNFTHALSKSIGRPVFRVIHNHFAATNNVGAVAAKEEVWEVSAELVGTVGSLGLLNALASLPDDGSVDKAAVTVGTWAVMQSMHVLFRYRALKCLRFPSLSEKRTRLLTTQHVLGLPMSNVDEANRAEPMFEIGGPWVLFPSVHIGTESVQQCLQGVSVPSSSSLQQHSSPQASSTTSSTTTSSNSNSSSNSSSSSSSAADSSSSNGSSGHVANGRGTHEHTLAQQSSTQQDAHAFSVRAALPHTQLNSPPSPSMSDSTNGGGAQHTQTTHSVSSSRAGSEASTSANPSSSTPQACSTAHALQHYLALYHSERYALVWKGGCAHVLLHEGAGPLDVLQAMWQTAWIHNQGQGQEHHAPSPSSPSSAPPSALPLSSSAAAQPHSSQGSQAIGTPTSQHAQHTQHTQRTQHSQQLHNEGLHGPHCHALEAASLAAARTHFPAFLQHVQALGYRLDQVTVHRGKVRVRVASRQQK